MATIIPIPALKDNYIWALIDETHKNAIIVDPGESLPVERFLEIEDLTLQAILITHHHWDHTNGITGLKKYCDLVIGPEADNIAQATQFVYDDDPVKVDGFPEIEFQVIAIPGHTHGHVAYYGNGILFSGDTLFAAGCGRHFEGTPEILYQSINRLARLPDETKMYCAHEYTLKNLQFAASVEPSNEAIRKRLQTVETLRLNNEPTLPSNIALEKDTNPFLRCQMPEIIANVEKFAGRRLTNEVDVFAWLRRWKDVS